MKSSSKLLSPQKAVENYLDTLLQEVTEPVIPEQESESDADAETCESTAVTETTEVQNNKAAEDQSTRRTEAKMRHQVAEIKTLGLSETSEKIEEKIPEQLIETLESSSIKSLHRYDFPMQCLMFNVSGNQMSVPLIDMGSVLPWGAKLTPLPHTPLWFIGLLIHREQKVRVVDTATFMQIKKIKKDEDSRHILVFGNDSWAMTCDKLGDVIKLNEQDVKWSQPGKPGLMLGTIKSSLAILLDPEKILMQLNQGI